MLSGLSNLHEECNILKGWLHNLRLCIYFLHETTFMFLYYRYYFKGFWLLTTPVSFSISPAAPSSAFWLFRFQILAMVLRIRLPAGDIWMGLRSVHIIIKSLNYIFWAHVFILPLHFSLFCILSICMSVCNLMQLYKKWFPYAWCEFL